MVVKAVVWFSFASLEFNFGVQFSIEEKLHFCFELQGLQRRSIKSFQKVIQKPLMSLLM